MPVGRDAGNAPASPEDLERLATTITSWAEGERAASDDVLAVDRLDDPTFGHRWFVRLRGDEKQVTTVWFHLRQRTLHFETQFMPRPEENREELFEMLLRLNARVQQMRFTIGWEEAIYLEGELPIARVDEGTLDQIIGAAYQYTEQWFRPCMRVGYRSKFRG
ncbi:MAG TPA: type III secretion system chaperone [Acidimicrobiales bacterium]